MYIAHSRPKATQTPRRAALREIAERRELHLPPPHRVAEGLTQHARGTILVFVFFPLLSFKHAGGMLWTLSLFLSLDSLVNLVRLVKLRQPRARQSRQSGQAPSSHQSKSINATAPPPRGSLSRRRKDGLPLSDGRPRTGYHQVYGGLTACPSSPAAAIEHTTGNHPLLQLESPQSSPFRVHLESSRARAAGQARVGLKSSSRLD